jgi:hypothetical protein
MYRRRIRRDARRRVAPGDVDSVLSRVGIGAVLHPSVFFAFPDRTGFLQHRDCPAAGRLSRCPHLVRHSDRSWIGGIRWATVRSPTGDPDVNARDRYPVPERRLVCRTARR